MATKIGDLVVNVDGDINKLRTEMRAAVGVVNNTVNDIQARQVALKNGFDTVLSPIRGITSMLGPLAAGFGAILSINAFGNLINQSAEAAGKLHDLSMQTGVSVEALSGLASVGKLSDVSLDMIASSANKMSKNLFSATEEGKGAAAALRALNIDFDSFKKLSPDQQMLTVANAMENFADGGGKTAAAMALMGKEGAAMLPFFKDLAAQGEINAKVTSEQTAMADNYGDNLVKIRGQSEAWKKQLAMSFLPVMDEVTSAYLAATSSSNGLGASIKRNASDGTFTNWARNAVIALTYLVDVGHGLLSVFDLIGTAIGGAVAASSAMFSSIYDAYNKIKSGDLNGAWEDIKSGARQTSFIAKETGKDIAAIWNQELLGEKIRKGMDAAKAAREEISVNNKKPQVEVDEPKKAAAEVRATDDKRKAYDSLIKSINEKISLQEQEQQNAQALTDGQKLASKVMVDLRDGVLKLNETEATHLGTLLEKLLAEEKSNASKKEMIKLSADLVKLGDDQVKSLDAQIEAAMRSNEEIGLNKEQVDALSRSRMELTAAADEELATNMQLAANYAGDLKDAYLDYADSLDEAAKKKRTLIQIKADGSERQAIAEESKRQLQAIDDDSKRFYDDLYRGLSDSLYRGFEAGKGFGRSFWDSLKNLAKTTVLKIAVQGVMTGVLGMGASGMANAQGLPSTGMSIMQSVAAGKSLWDSFSTAAGAAGMAGSMGAGIAGFGNLIGSSTISAFGSGMGLSTAAAGQAAGAYGAAGMAGTGSALSAGSSVAAAMPYVAAALAVGAILKKGLSMGDKQMTGQTVAGNLGTNDLSRNVSWTQKGGFLRSDRSDTWRYQLSNSTATTSDGKSYQDSASVSSDQAMLKGLNAGYDALKKASADFAKSLGLSADLVTSRTDAMSFKIGATQEETDKAIAEMFAGIGDNIARALLPSIGELSKEGEGASATLARVAGNVGSVNSIFSDLGLKLFDLNTAGYKSASMFTELMGGMESMKQITASYYQNFYSEEERKASAMKLLTAEFEKQNQVIPSSREAYRALVEQIRNTGTPEQLASLLKLNGAFAELVKETEAATLATNNASAAAERQAAIAQERAGLQDEYNRLTMTQAQLLQQQRDKLDASNQSLFDSINAVKAKQAADEAAAQSMARIASERAGLQDQLDQIMMTPAQLLAKQRATLDKSNQSLFDDLQNATAAKAAADALKQTNAGIQSQIDDLIRSTMSLEDVRKAELVGIDKSTASLKNRLFALQDEAKVTESLKAAAEARSAGFSDMMNKAVGGMQDAAKAFDALADTMKQARDSLLTGDKSGLSVQEKLYVSKQRLNGADAKDLPGLSNEYLGLLKESGMSGIDYQREFASMVNRMDAFASDFSAKAAAERSPERYAALSSFGEAMAKQNETAKYRDVFAAEYNKYASDIQRPGMFAPIVQSGIGDRFASLHQTLDSNSAEINQKLLDEIKALREEYRKSRDANEKTAAALTSLTNGSATLLVENA